MTYLDICYDSQSAHFFLCNWENLVFLAVSSISLPLYVLILWKLIGKRRVRDKESTFRGVFYHILISQGIADIFAMGTHVIGTVVTVFQLGIPFIMANKSFFAPLSVGVTYYFVLIRSFGDLLFALQRSVLSLSFGSVVGVHWLLPAAFSIPTWVTPASKDLYVFRGLLVEGFDNPEEIYMLMLCIWVVITFSITISIDFYLVYFVSVASKDSPARTTRELRIFLILLTQAGAFSLILVYYVAKTLVMFELYVLMVRIWGPLQRSFSLFNGVESYVNPWVYMILNRQLREAVFPCLKRKKMSDVLSVTTI